MSYKTIKAALCITALSLIAMPVAHGQEIKSIKEARVKEAKELEAMLKQLDSALIKLKALLNPKFTLVQYDVRHLLYRPEDRIAPSLSIPSASAGYRTNKGGGSLSFGDDEENYEGAIIDPDKLTEAIRDLADEDDWEDPATVEVNGGFLIVYQTKRTHARIRKTLDALVSASLRSIQMEVCFYSLPPELKRSLGQAALLNKGLIAKNVLQSLDLAIANKKAKMRGNAILTALSDQKVYLHQGFEQSYVATIERSSGGTGMTTATVSDPIIEVLRTGMALDMRGTVIERGGSKQVAMDVCFTVAV